MACVGQVLHECWGMRLETFRITCLVLQKYFKGYEPEKAEKKTLNLVQSVGNHMYKRCASWTALFSNLHCIILGRQKRR